MVMVGVSVVCGDGEGEGCMASTWRYLCLSYAWKTTFMHCSTLPRYMWLHQPATATSPPQICKYLVVPHLQSLSRQLRKVLWKWKHALETVTQFAYYIIYSTRRYPRSIHHLWMRGTDLQPIDTFEYSTGRG